MPPRQLPSLPATLSGNVLLCVTGSVAAVRRGPLYTAIMASPSVSSCVILSTESATRFPDTPPLPPSAITLCDADEDVSWRALGDPVLHIQLRDWADVLVLAPLSANTLAKLSLGLCDNLVTCVARAWRPEKAVVVAPAMNTAMWEHPATRRHISALTDGDFGAVVHIVAPVEKTLACGDTGVGAMAPPSAIAEAVRAALVRTGRSSCPIKVEDEMELAHEAEHNSWMRVNTENVAIMAPPAEGFATIAPPAGMHTEPARRSNFPGLADAAAIDTHEAVAGGAGLETLVRTQVDKEVSAEVEKKVKAAVDSRVEAIISDAIAARMASAVATVVSLIRCDTTVVDAIIASIEPTIAARVDAAVAALEGAMTMRVAEAVAALEASISLSVAAAVETAECAVASRIEKTAATDELAATLGVAGAISNDEDTASTTSEETAAANGEAAKRAVPRGGLGAAASPVSTGNRVAADPWSGAVAYQRAQQRKQKRPRVKQFSLAGSSILGAEGTPMKKVKARKESGKATSKTQRKTQSMRTSPEASSPSSPPLEKGVGAATTAAPHEGAVTARAAEASAALEVLMPLSEAAVVEATGPTVASRFEKAAATAELAITSGVAEAVFTAEDTAPTGVEEVAVANGEVTNQDVPRDGLGAAAGPVSAGNRVAADPWSGAVAHQRAHQRKQKGPRGKPFSPPGSSGPGAAATPTKKVKAQKEGSSARPANARRTQSMGASPQEAPPSSPPLEKCMPRWASTVPRWLLAQEAKTASSLLATAAVVPPPGPAPPTEVQGAGAPADKHKRGGSL